MMTKTHKELADVHQAENMVEKLRERGVSIDHFNVIAGIIDAKYARRKEAHQYGKKYLMRRGCHICKRTARHLVFLIVYCFVGALCYHALEYPNEKAATLEYDETAEFLVESANVTDVNIGTGNIAALAADFASMELADDAATYNVIPGQPDPSTMVDRLHLVIKEATEHNAAPREDGELRWEVDTAFFWLLTVATTVGYGQFNPVTLPGQLLTLPLGLLAVLVAGYSLLALGYSICIWLEVLLASCLPTPTMPSLDRSQDDSVRSSIEEQRIPAKRSLLVTTMFLALYLPLGSMVFWALAEAEDWGTIEAMYYAFVTLTTIGFGDYVPDDRWLVFAAFYICFGVGVMQIWVMAATELYITQVNELTDQTLTAPDEVMYPLDWIHTALLSPSKAARTDSAMISVKPGLEADYVLLGEGAEAASLTAGGKKAGYSD